MNSSIQILPGIKKIYWLDSDTLPARVDLYSVIKMRVAPLADLNEMTFFGDPDCRRSTERDNNGLIQKATLKFNSADEIPFDKNIAFIVTDANDRSYLIGSCEKPFARIKVEKLTGAPSEDAAGYSYEVSHESVRTMIECLI